VTIATPPFSDRRHLPLSTPGVAEAIGRELLRLARPDWLPVLLKWLKRYAGIESHLDHEEDFPEVAVVDYLRQLEPPLDDESFALGLSTLPFTFYCAARHIESDVWNPCLECFQTFQERGVAVWQTIKDPDPQINKTWLLAQLRLGEYFSA
jgi:hypothetical protein